MLHNTLSSPPRCKRSHSGGGRRAEGQRRSYCVDCEVIKERAQARGFSVAQMCDAFQRNDVQEVLGPQYDFIIGGSRFDASSAAWTTPAPASTPALKGDASRPQLSSLPPAVAAASVEPVAPALGADNGPAFGDKRAADAENGGDDGRPGKRRKRKPSDAGEGAHRAGDTVPPLTDEELAAMRKRCALCKCARRALVRWCLP